MLVVLANAGHTRKHRAGPHTGSGPSRSVCLDPTGTAGNRKDATYPQEEGTIDSTVVRGSEERRETGIFSHPRGELQRVQLLNVLATDQGYRHPAFSELHGQHPRVTEPRVARGVLGLSGKAKLSTGSDLSTGSARA